MQTSFAPSRRTFLKELLWLTSGVAVARAADDRAAITLPQGQLPKIKLGHLEVSRLILGSNPFFGFAHGNPQASPQEMTAYYTEDRVMAVLDDAADQGVTAGTPCYDHWIRLWNKYRERGRKSLYERYGGVRRPSVFLDLGITGQRSVAVDFSGKCGAPVLVAVAGEKPLDKYSSRGISSVATVRDVSAGKANFRVLTMSRGQAPSVGTEGDRVRVGGRKFSFDGLKLVVE